MENVRGLLFRYRIWWHILFWIVWYFFYTITYSQGVFTKFQLLQNLYLLPVRMAGTYLLIYWILPKFMFRRKYFLFTILMVIHAIFYGFSIMLVLDLLHGAGPRINDNFIRSIVLNYQIPATAMAIYMFKRWHLIQHNILNLEKEKLEAELKFLKSQIHPHFLFNTLNNLYALTLQKSDKAPDVVIKLSNLLEYTLYSEKKAEVELSEEFKLLTGYIDLEVLRFGQRLKISQQINGNHDGLLIAPLLLLPFIENSFKHGAGKDTKAPFIDIRIDLIDKQLLFSVKNSFHSDPGKKEKYNEGIGLKNVKRRLELLYPDRHDLEIIQNDDVFTVKLKLDLNDTLPKKT
jgi:sensor histidine kinase YesM